LLGLRGNPLQEAFYVQESLKALEVKLVFHISGRVLKEEEDQQTMIRDGHQQK